MTESAPLEDLSVYQAMNPKLLTKAQKRGAALHAINLKKEKRDGNLKGRSVADKGVKMHGARQPEATSPSTPVHQWDIGSDVHTWR